MNVNTKKKQLNRKDILWKNNNIFHSIKSIITFFFPLICTRCKSIFSSNQLKTMLQTQQIFFTTCWDGRFWLVQHHFYCIPNIICYSSSYESLLSLIIHQPMSHCHYNIKILNALNIEKVWPSNCNFWFGINSDA